jgi:hypothetical protein
MIVRALKQDDHVFLGGVITNTLYKAATVNGGTLESVERDRAAVLHPDSLSRGGTRKGNAKPARSAREIMK